ncbi:MAG: hypothetical protein AW07_04240 [Candidatus Accumulibacter sp. SK-11]|nr:MAG: hypothetical protein AW07_04240 [Candidatus Accumulibacter sp. SK-11]
MIGEPGGGSPVQLLHRRQPHLPVELALQELPQERVIAIPLASRIDRAGENIATADEIDETRPGQALTGRVVVAGERIAERRAETLGERCPQQCGAYLRRLP